MPTNRPLDVKTYWGFVCPVSPADLRLRRAFGKKVVKGQGIGFFVAGVLVILAACLAVGLVAHIVLGAFDSDPELWPFGSEDFNVTLHNPFDAGLQSIRVFTGLAAILCLVATAGAHLILSHRARSALATDRHLPSTPLNMAEPCRQDLNDAPVLGHFYSWGLGDDDNVSGKTRPAPLGPLAHVLRFADCSLF